MKVKLKNVRPNPFRKIDAYPIERHKVEQLKKSILSTDFWDNIVARKVDSVRNQPVVEIAYGHHRWTALNELYEGDVEFDFIVRDLDDAEMIKIMAHENLDEWKHNSDIERETIRAIVTAVADGKVSLGKPSKDAPDSKLRFAPSFVMGNKDLGIPSRESRERVYNANMLANFLDGTMEVDQVKRTLNALELIELGHLKESQLSGLTNQQAREVVSETSRAARQAEAIRKEAQREAMTAATPVLEKKIKSEGEKKAKAIVKQTATAVSKELQKGGSTRDAKFAGTQARVAIQGKEKELPEINQAASRLCGQVERLLDPEYDPGKKLDEIIKHKKHLSDVSMQNLDRALEIVIEYAEGFRARLNK